LPSIAVWIWTVEVRNDRLATESASGKLLIVQNHTTGLMKIYSLLQPPLCADIIFEELIFEISHIYHFCNTELGV
jgi:hypothetical protein